MKKKNTTKPSSGTDWKKLAKLKDKDIDNSDIPALGENFFAQAELKLPQNKSTITIRLDRDILDWFKQQGSRYQTKINAVLRMYVMAKNKS